MGNVTLNFEAPVGLRIRRYGWAVTTSSSELEPLWWCDEFQRWITDAERTASYKTDHGLTCSSHCPRVRTLAAFRRHVRRHATELAGREVVWVNRYEGHNVTALLAPTIIPTPNDVDGEKR